MISQFEKPEDPKKKNLFTQNQEMLRNQLALTEGLRDNQKAITYGFKLFDRLADVKELPGNPWEDEKESDEIYKDAEEYQESKEKGKKTIPFNLEKNFEEDDLIVIEKKYGYPPPSKLTEYNHKDLTKIAEHLKENIKKLNGVIVGRSRKKDPDESYLSATDVFEEERSSLLKYEKAINDYITSFDYQTGQGIRNHLYFSPQELIKRLELLGGSLAAGNNGVLHEYIQIAHRLRDLGIFTNNQLNKLLKSI